MSDTIKIDIVSDVVCPWCIIGYKRLMLAASDLRIENHIEIEWHPFQLNPLMPPHGEEVHVHMMKKYGMTAEDCHDTLSQMTDLGERVGFTFDFFPGFKMVNTADLHVLLDYAKDYGKQTELKLHLFTACFTDHQDVSDRKVLKEALTRVGLDAKTGMGTLENTTTRNKVLAHERYWKNAGVTGVPTMVFSKTQKYTGAQPVSIYKQVLSSYLAGTPSDVPEPLPIIS